MVSLEHGDSGPLIVALQVLLNRRGAGLTVDGHFGRWTRSAVVYFQKRYKIGERGVVGTKTWRKLLEGTGLKVVNALDVTDEEMLLSDCARLKREGVVREGKVPGGTAVCVGSQQKEDIVKAGGKPIEVRGPISNGVQHVVQEIIHDAGRPGSIVLLRFYGHGGAGYLIIGAGTGGQCDRQGGRIMPTEQFSAISMKNLHMLVPILSLLRDYFAPFGSVEMHNCSVGKGRKGEALLNELAELWGVPVTAGRIDQANVETFHLEGPVYTAYPGRDTPASWASKQADLEARRRAGQSSRAKAAGAGQGTR
jgi:hypothetical protein